MGEHHVAAKEEVRKNIEQQQSIEQDAAKKIEEDGRLQVRECLATVFTGTNRRKTSLLLGHTVS